MKKLLFISLVFLLFACGGGESPEISGESPEIKRLRYEAEIVREVTIEMNRLLDLEIISGVITDSIHRRALLIHNIGEEKVKMYDSIVAKNNVAFKIRKDKEKQEIDNIEKKLRER